MRPTRATRSSWPGTWRGSAKGRLAPPLSPPGLKRGAEAVEAATPLGQDAARQYRALAARANYLSLDCPDIVRGEGVL